MPKFHEVFRKTSEISVFYAVIVMIMTIILKKSLKIELKSN